MNLKLDFFNNRYFIEEITNEQIVLLEIPKTFLKFYLKDSNTFDFKWLVSKCSIIYIKF